MKYRKKPVVIEAVELNWKTFQEIINWGNGEIKFWHSEEAKNFNNPTGQCLLIPTLEGDHTAQIGDYIIKGVKGEFYPCKPDIFEMTYERIGED